MKLMTVKDDDDDEDVRWKMMKMEDVADEDGGDVGDGWMMMKMLG